MFVINRAMIEIPVLTFKLLVISQILTERQLIHDRAVSRDSWYETYDFILVGGGSAGCAIAKRLTENPNVKVLLLEAGGAQNAIYTDIPAFSYNIADRAPQNQYVYHNEPQITVAKQFLDRRPPETFGRGLGGGSLHNSMIYNRGNRRNYDEWANKYGAKGWSYEEVLPYFKRFENNTDLNIVQKNPKYHATTGPVQVTTPKKPSKILNLLKKAFNELGFESTDFNGPKQTGTMITQSYIDGNGIRSTSANAYIERYYPIPDNLHIVAKAQVIKILFKGLTAVGVEFARSDKPYKVYARKEVILTAGVANTPKILMLSGIGITSDLRQFGIPVLTDLPVGNNYFNHPQTYFDVKINDPANFDITPHLSIDWLSELFYQKGGPLSQFPYLGLYYSTKDNFPSDFPNQLLFARTQNDTLTIYSILVRNRTPGTIRLQSNSPYVPPKIDPSFLVNPLDFSEAMDGIKFIFYFLEKSSIARYVTPPTFESLGCTGCGNTPRYECIEGIKCLIKYNTISSSHPCCSCRMGAVHRDDVVVDPQLRVKNVKQLRICDSSVFSSKPNSNMNAPTLMVAEKCAQMIKDFHKLN